MEERIFLSSPTMNGHEKKYIQEAFESNWIAPLGPNVDEFERELSAYVGIAHAAALSSGTAAIHLALKAVGIGAGDLVFCSDLTFSATCNPILYQNAVPIFIDSERDSWNMSTIALEKAFRKYPNVKAVIVANLYGVPAKLIEIQEICRHHQAALIEDAAESLGAEYEGRQTGTFGKLGIYSFNGNKIITTSGGGMLVSDDEEMVKKARFWATQSREPSRCYEHKEVGYNYRMSNIVAGIGRGQLKSLEDHVKKKKWIYDTYRNAFQSIPDIMLNPIPGNCSANYWLSCITLDKKSKCLPLDLIMALEEENIESRPIWKPLHLQPVFAKSEYVKEMEKSVSEDIFDRGVCLPSDIKNTERDMERIVDIIKSLFM